MIPIGPFSSKARFMSIGKLIRNIPFGTARTVSISAAKEGVHVGEISTWKFMVVMCNSVRGHVPGFGALQQLPFS